MDRGRRQSADASSATKQVGKEHKWVLFMSTSRERCRERSRDLEYDPEIVSEAGGAGPPCERDEGRLDRHPGRQVYSVISGSFVVPSTVTRIPRRRELGGRQRRCSTTKDVAFASSDGVPLPDG